MADLIPPFPTDGYPIELVEAVVVGADADARRVVAYLRAAGFGQEPGGAGPIPADVVLDLAAVLRLRAWEAAGLTAHLEAGLPSAEVAMKELIATMRAAANDPDALARVGRLSQAVFGVQVTRFIWAGPRELRAEVALDDIDDDRFVEVLATFLWAARHPSGTPV